MKRIVALLLILCLLLAVPAVAVNEAQTLLETVKSRIGDTTEYETFYSSSYTSGGQTVYSFNWEDNDSESYRSLYVSVTAGGIITEYNAYSEKDNSREEKPTLDRVPADTVLAAAQEFVQRINPDIAGHLLLTSRQTTQSLWSKSYRFTVQRMENGIPVYGDNGSLTVSGDGRTVTGFHLQYTEGLTFSDPAKAISREAAEKAYAEKLGVELQYRTRYEDGKKTVYPAYVAKAQYGTYIDAFTGKPVTPITAPYGSNDKLFGNTTESAGDAAATGGSLSPAEQQEMQNTAGLMSVQSAELLLRNIDHLGITADMELTSSGLSKQYRGERYLYSIQFKSETMTVSVTLDAKTGQILSVNRYGELTGTQITDDVAKKRAQDVANRLAWAYLEYYRLNEDGCSYTRYANGVPYYDDGIFVEIDRKTGQLTRFSLQHSDVEFPSVEGVLTPMQASEKLFAQVDYSLYYVRDCISNASRVFDKSTLVYMFPSGAGELDPFTGEMEKNVAAVLPEYTDIAGHYGEKAIRTLRQFGIGFASGEYRPNATITQGEFLELLRVVFFGMDSAVLTEGADYADAKRVAVNEGVVDSDADLSQPLTREMAAVLLVRAMGFEPVASLQGIYVSPFRDVTEYVGHVSILGAMGVFNGDGNGNFLPEKLLTRADAAVVLYNYLNA